MTMFSQGDHAFPYRAYQSLAGVWVSGGTIQMPLAFTSGIPASVCRVLQVAQPRTVLQIRWAGTRMNAKPAPPQIVAANDFVLAHASATIHGITFDSMGNDIVTAAGFLLLYSTGNPTAIQMPAFWMPWDGRADANPAAAKTYIYTPADLGFSQFLPGAQQSQPASKIINNPPISGTNFVQFI